MSEILCVATMLRDDYDFLEKWVEYYSKQVKEKSHLYVVSHGENPRIREIAAGCSIMVIPHFDNGSQFEIRRRKMFFGMVAMLNNYFRHVIVTDVDEFIVLNPSLGQNLADYLNSKTFEGRVLSPLGFDVVHKPSEEPGPYRFDTPLTEQRHHGYLEGAYTKPCIFREAPVDGGNAHFINGEPWDIDINIMLFHMKYFDQTYGHAMAGKRLETVLDYEKLAKTHRIGGWHNRAEKLETTIARIEAEPVRALTPEIAMEFAQGIRRDFEQRGRFPWATSQRGPFEIPEDFWGSV